MAMTLLEIVQDVLSELNSDSVNTVADTEEAVQVAKIARSVYDSMLAEYKFPTNEKLVKLDASVLGKPNYLRLPAGVKDLIWLKYDCSIDNIGKPEYNDVKYVTPYEFINRVFNENADSPTVVYVTENGTQLPIRSDSHPSYYTSFDDEYIVFNSFNIAVDTEVQASKSVAYAESKVYFNITSNSYKPPIPEHLFPLFLNEVKSNAYVSLKQTQNPMIDRQARRLRYSFQKNKQRMGQEQRVAFGRR